MFDSITGRVIGTEDGQVLLETGPVVLSLLCPGYFIRHVTPGDTGRYFVLFGIMNEGNRGIPMAVVFPTREDRQFFTQFISVSGIGVRAAAKAMVIPPLELARAIASGDIKALKSLPGIGLSRAKQIVAKLQDSMSRFADGVSPSLETGGSADARAILEQLGIPSAEALSLIRRALDEAGHDASPSDLVRLAMKARGSHGS